MNLRQLANTAIQSVNPDIPVLWRHCTGQHVLPDRLETRPIYEDFPLRAQVQALTEQELQHQEDGLNIQGESRVVFLNTGPRATSRLNQHGPDLLVINGATWKVMAVSEAWPGWVRLLVRLTQNNPAQDGPAS